MNNDILTYTILLIATILFIYDIYSFNVRFEFKYSNNSIYNCFTKSNVIFTCIDFIVFFVLFLLTLFTFLNKGFDLRLAVLIFGLLALILQDLFSPMFGNESLLINSSRIIKYSDVEYISIYPNLKGKFVNFYIKVDGKKTMFKLMPKGKEYEELLKLLESKNIKVINKSN